MGNDFAVYLFYIVIIGGLILSLFFFIFKKLIGKGASSGKDELIQGGNIGIFFDKDENVTIIPYAKDKYGVGRAVASPVVINKPYNEQGLGKKIRYSMKLCDSSGPCNDNELMAALNFTGWKEFSEGKRNISVHYQKGHGIVFNTTRRRADGSYQFNFFGFEHVIPNDITDKQMGETLLSLLPRCRG
jgi:hypothetical protein